MEHERWTLVETLGQRSQWSALALDRRTTQWKSLARALPVGTLDAVHAAHDSRTRIDTELPPSRLRKEGNFVAAAPVFGPDNVVHGVQVRVAAEPIANAPLRAVAGFRYYSAQRSIEVSGNPFGWFETPPDRASWTVPEAFQFVERCDGAMDLIRTDPFAHKPRPLGGPNHGAGQGHPA